MGMAARASSMARRAPLASMRHACLVAAAVLLLAAGTAGAGSAPSDRSPSRRLAQTDKQPPTPSAEAAGCCARLAGIGFHSELPAVVLDTGGKKVPHHVDTPASLCTCNSGAPFQDYTGRAILAGRGTSSANFTKKSYKVQLQTASGAKDSFPLLGMPKDDDWILYGDEIDKTLGMRNYLTYNLARASGRYASRTVWVEVFLVDDGAALGERHYNGLYIAEEKVKRAKQRVNITKLAAPDLSGGYIFLYDNDNIEAGDVTFGPADGWDHPFVLKDPNAAPDGGAALLRYIDQYQSALEAPDWLQRGAASSYAAFIDAPAFVDFFLLVELSKSPDGYRGSTYMHKDRGGPLVMGPAWDFNEAYGECCGYPIDGWQRKGASGPGVAGGSAISPEGWRFNICADPGRCLVEPKSASSRWAQLRAGPWSDVALTTLIQGTMQRIRPAAVRNYNRYAAVFETTPETADTTWTGEVQRVQEWLLKRVYWMDGAFSMPQAAGTAG